MSHQLAQHVDGGAGVGVPLGVAVPVGVERDFVLGVFGAVGVLQGRHGVEPFAVRLPQEHAAIGLRAIRVEGRVGEQRQLADRRAWVSRTDAVLLLGDQRGGGVGDRQPTADPVVLEVLVDQHVLAVVVGAHAVPGQPLNFVGPASGVDEHLKGQAHVSAVLRLAAAPVTACSFDGGQTLAELGEDVAGQCPAAAVVVRSAGDIAFAHGEVVGQRGEHLGGAGQAEFADIPQEAGRPLADRDPEAGTDLAGVFQIGEPLQERDDVLSPEQARVVAGVSPVDPQTVRQPGQAGHHPHEGVGDVLAVAAWDGVDRPRLRGAAQPFLAQSGEVHPAALSEPENLHVPHVLELLKLRRGQPAAHVVVHRANDPDRQGVRARDQLVERGDLLGSGVVAELPEFAWLGGDQA